MYRAFLNYLKKSLPLFGTLGGLGGFIADILQPIAPFSNYAFFISIGATILLSILVYFKANIRELLI